jgi:hypothetical protein
MSRRLACGEIFTALSVIIILSSNHVGMFFVTDFPSFQQLSETPLETVFCPWLMLHSIVSSNSLPSK